MLVIYLTNRLVVDVALTVGSVGGALLGLVDARLGGVGSDTRSENGLRRLSDIFDEWTG
jgi:hypothetical protein